jgi:hypothetical protein
MPKARLTPTLTRMKPNISRVLVCLLGFAYCAYGRLRQRLLRRQMLRLRNAKGKAKPNGRLLRRQTLRVGNACALRLRQRQQYKPRNPTYDFSRFQEFCTDNTFYCFFNSSTILIPFVYKSILPA